MTRIRRQLPGLLVALIALRALVPVGYMLSVPTAPGGAPGLVLCPLQNPALDVAKLSGPDAGHDAHAAHGANHGHAHGKHGGATDAPLSVAVSSGDCSLWLASAAPAALIFNPAFPVVIAAREKAPAPADLVLPRTLRRSTQPRAPPQQHV